ncbi:hypothetical protein FN846DRAFT_902046 [Sphaerosporella brunnea]|uniref:Uncharacterized protein n=1 Tax=Sphaerosporella brunnea TaxID=1250544 RepID=A0A5J5FBE1_9PEZI|nr:hypothetical protein FN846DRAFT_902046 [Sphaerosporella brunnea]
MAFEKGGQPLSARVNEMLESAWKEVTRDNLLKRIFKCVLATSITVIIMLLPGIARKILSFVLMMTIDAE